MMNEMDQKLRDYYESKSISDSKMDEIINAGKMVRSPIWSQPVTIITLAACFILFTGLISSFYLKNQDSFGEIIAKNILKNNQKLLEPEINSNDFLKIQSALPKLHFRISPTKTKLLAGLTILGGRYCSIHNELAAQIRLNDTEGNICSLYIAPLTKNLANIDSGIYSLDKGVVHVWRDEHRLFALAR